MNDQNGELQPKAKVNIHNGIKFLLGPDAIAVELSAMTNAMEE
jgi:hypothetical protein